jgi:hypothetical protein
MSSGYPPQEYQNGIPQQNVVLMQSQAPVGVQAPSVSPAKKNTGPVHAENLDKVSGTQKRTVTVFIQGTPAQFAKGAGVVNRAQLSRAVVEGMKRPLVTRNRHRAKDSELLGDPTKTVIKSIKLLKGFNGTSKHLSADIDNMYPEAAPANGRPCSFVLPRTPKGPIDLNVTLKEPINIVTDKMLAFKGLLAGARYEITPDADPNEPYWTVKTRTTLKDNGGREVTRPSFSLCLLNDMIIDGEFKKSTEIQKGIAEAMVNPNLHQLSLPKEMLERVQGEIKEGEQELTSSMVNLYEWGITFNPADGSSWTDHDGVHGVSVGTDMSNRRAADKKINGVVQEAWVQMEIEYGMTL